MKSPRFSYAKAQVYNLIGYRAALTHGEDFAHGSAELRFDIVQICAMV